MISRIVVGVSFLLFGGLFHSGVESVRAQEGEQLLSDPGVVSYSFRNQFEKDVPGTLDLIKNTGLKNIEFSSGHKSGTGYEYRILLYRR